MDYIKVKAKDAELRAAHPDWTDQQVCDWMNAETVSRNKSSLTGSEALNAIDKAEFISKTAEEKELVWNILHLGMLNPFGIEAALLVDIFGAQSVTITALKVLRVELISWAESEGLETIFIGTVQQARTM